MTTGFHGNQFCVLCASGDHDPSVHDTSLSTLFEDDPPGEPQPVRRHFLIVHEDVTEQAFDDGESGMDVEHPDCEPETEELDSGITVVSYRCGVEELIYQAGLNDFFLHRDAPAEEPGWERYQGVPRLAPGRYEIEDWYTHYPAGPWGGEEWDAGLRLVDDPAETGS